MKKSILFALFITFNLLYSCNFNKNKKITAKTNKQNKCLTIKERENIVSLILKNKEVTDFLTFNIKNNKSIKLLKTKYINDSLHIVFNGKKLDFVNNISDYKYSVKIALNEVKCNETMNFSFYYKAAGAHVEGILKKENFWLIDKLTFVAEE
ncbi:hypothetical protein ACQY1Q_15215 [Tenacibaculum sp. TC6]|uniref:hypothetical protein n=1 Tax=Tenacibaculum sp. TC6 TaxID=3423223 RepID=UPI003D35CA64